MGGMADHPERGHARFTPVEMRRLWTYSDGAATVKAYRWPSGTAGAGRWVLVDQKTGNVQGVVPPGEFSRRFRPVDRFADVPGLPTYLETVTASDGTAQVDLALDRNPFMLANGPGRVTPHVTGNYDYLLQVEVADLAAYEDFHANRLASLPGVAMVNSYVTMKTLSPGAIG